MKLIDKYLLRSLAVPLVYCMLGFALIYVIYDLFDNLPDFVDASTPFPEVLRFYTLLMPSVLIIIAPISMLLAVLYSLSQLTKNNELTAMRASGVSTARLIMPLLTIGLLVTLIVGVVHETVGPWSAYWTDQFVHLQRRKGRVDIEQASNIAFKNEVQRRIWLVDRFHKRTFEMQQVSVIQQREDGSDAIKYQAREARWLDGRWWFIELVTQFYDTDGNPMGPARFELHREMRDITETPRDFMNEIKDPQFLSSLEILNFLRTHPHLSRDTKTRIRVDLHNRLAMPWTCLIVTLIGIPFGSQAGRRGVFIGAFLAIGLFFSYYFLINLGLALGKKQLMAPWLAGWLPNLVFLSLSVHLIRRMR